LRAIQSPLRDNDIDSRQVGATWFPGTSGRRNRLAQGPRGQQRCPALVFRADPALALWRDDYRSYVLEGRAMEGGLIALCCSRTLRIIIANAIIKNSKIIGMSQAAMQEREGKDQSWPCATARCVGFTGLLCIGSAK
jgi:hypothetical protein